MTIVNRKILFSLYLTIYTFSTSVFAEINHYEAALQAYNQQDIDTAFIHLKNALRSNERNLPAKLLFAKVLINKGSFAAAEQELNDAIAFGVDVNLVVEPLGESIIKQGNFELALTYADSMPLQSQGNLAYQLVKGKAYLGLGDMDNAELEYKNLLASNPNNVDALLGLATVYVYLKNNSEAKPILTKVNALAPNNSKSWQLQGQILRNEGQLEEALSYLKKAVELEPENIGSLRILTNLYVDLENFTMANQFADRVLALTPNDPQIKFVKGSILKQLDQSELAKQLLSELTNQFSALDENWLLSQPQLLLLDAMTSYTNQDWTQARSKFQRYLSQASEQTEISAIMLLADVHQQLKQPRDALQLLEKYERKLLNNKDYTLILAGLYLQFEKYFKADFILSKLLKEHPKDESVLILSAQVLAGSGQSDKALALLESADINGGQNFQYALALLSLGDGKSEQALSHIEPLSASYPDNVNYQLLYMQTLIQLSQFEQAKELIDDLYRRYPESRDVRYNYALFQFNIEKFDEAEQVLKQILEKNADDNESSLMLAKVQYQLGNKESAISRFETLSKNTHYRRQALEQLTNIYIDTQELSKGLSTVDRMLNDNRLDISALFKKAEILQSLNRYIEAKRQLDILTGLIDNDVDDFIKLSALQQNVRDLSGAEYSLEQAYELSPNSLSVIIDLVKLKIGINKINEAKKILAAANKSEHSGNVYLTILTGDIFNAQNNVRKAFDYYLQALNTDPNNIIAVMKLAQTSSTENFSKKFIEELTQVITKNPSYVLHRHILADHLLDHGQYEQAKFQYQTLLTHNIPLNKRALALNNLANIYIRDKDYALAITTAQQAMDVVENAPAILDTMGWSLVLSGEVEQGLSYLRQAFSLSSTSTDIQYHIAYALEQSNRLDEAKQILSTLVALPYEFNERKLAKELLDKLTKQ